MSLRRLALLLVLPATALAAAPDSPGAGSAATTLTSLPPGLYLPVSLANTLHAGRTPAGTAVTLRTTQRIPLGNRTFLPRGTVLHATLTASAADPATLTLQPASLTLHGKSIPLSATVLAVASFVAVDATGAPANGSTDRGNPDPASWTTAQVGGEQVMRSGWYGPLINGATQTVGSADPWGVYTLPPAPGTPPRALGPFSAGAQGLFGYPTDCRLSANPTQNTLSCPKSSLVLHHGDALLLQVSAHP